MATSTSNLGLTLPSVNDAADIAVLNSNFQKIDGKIPAAGAAPSGYGLGGAVYTADLNKAIKPGWYYTDGKTANTGRYYTIVHVKAYGNEQFVEQVQTDMNLTNFDRLHRYSKDGGATWTEEWENPLMQLGVEYRTTERFNGSPVYVKAVSCGKGPSGGAVNLPTGLSGNVTFVEANCKAVSDAGWGVFLNQYLSFGEKGSGTATLSISGAGDLSARNIYLTMKYIKG